MAMGNGCPAALPAQRPPAKTCHLCRKPSLIDKDQALWIKVGLAIEPCLTSLQEICPLLLQCMGGLFLNVQPRQPSHMLRALRPI